MSSPNSDSEGTESPVEDSSTPEDSKSSLIPEAEALIEEEGYQVEPIRLRFRKVRPVEDLVPDYILAESISDPYRQDIDVRDEMEARKPPSPMDIFFDTVRGVDHSMKDRQDKIAQQRAILVLQYFVFPWIEGYAGEKKISPEDQVAYMVSTGQTMGFFFQGENRNQVMQIVQNPRIRGMLTLLRPFLKVEDDVLRERQHILWWLDRIKETRQGYYTVIRRYGRAGELWLGESLVDIFNFIKGVTGIV